MLGYKEYKEWWLNHGINFDLDGDLSHEEQFMEHINEMSTYELIETLTPWWVG
jgi:hypothetical protein